MAVIEALIQKQKTHKKVNNPQISARFLAEYMAASEQAKRTIVRNCKFQPIARVIQHDEAKLAITTFIRNGSQDVGLLTNKAQGLRNRFASDDFDRDLFDHNADYIERFAINYSNFALPTAEILPAGTSLPVFVNGVKITNELAFRLRRTTKTNKVRVGGATLRYAKGKSLLPEIAAWQAAFILGSLNLNGLEDGQEPEGKLCLIVDAYSGMCHPAPSDSARRYKNMQAACASIAERWPNIEPPANAVF